MAGDEEKNQPKRIFLGWDRPVVDLAVEYLLQRAGDGSGGWVDLSELLVVVPTRNAGRRLREALALAADGDGRGMLPPQLWVPEDFVRFDGGPTVASTTAARLAWIEELRVLELDEYRELFPVAPPDQGFDWAMQVAAELATARAVLAEGALQAGDLVNGEGGETMPERGRWEEIARLERAVTGRLRRAGFEEPEAAKIKTAQSWQVPESIGKVVMMAVPDPLGLAIEAIRSGIQRGPVEVDVCIHAPESAAGGFDQWGRPRAEFWQRRVLREPVEQSINLAANPMGQQAAVLELLRSRCQATEHTVAVGCADADVLPLLRRGLEEAGVAVFDPEGESFRGHSLFGFLTNFTGLLRSGGYRDFLEMLRNPTWLDSLAGKFAQSGQGGAFDAARVLAAFDSLAERVLPATFEDAMEALRRDRAEDKRHHRPLAGQWLVGDAVRTMLTRFRDEPFAEAVAGLMADWLGEQRLRSDEADAQVLGEVGEKSRELAGEMARVAERGTHPADLLQLMLEGLAGVRYYIGDRLPTDLELQGWLELPWESADDLVVAGFNDGLVPAAIVGDVFLPDSVRKQLGLNSNEERFARDRYLLEAMTSWRRAAGRSMELVLGKVNGGGDPLRPSRLLFQCEDADLPPRVRHLFGEDPEFKGEGAVPAWSLAWKLKPPLDRAAVIDRLPAKLSVTSFSDYLACPFRYYLKRLQGMEKVDPLKAEMDGRDFGSFCHRALERLAPGSALAREDRVEKVYGELVDALSDDVRRVYGPQPPATILLQLEVAASRMRIAAEFHVAALAEGWEGVAVEKEFGKQGDWELGGIAVAGTIDRIEKNAAGRYRLIDYKTSAKAVTAFEAHLQVLKRGERTEDFPEWMLYELPEGGKIYRWVNLQLPIYCLWAERHLAGKGNVECGYVNLPKALGEGGYRGWGEGMDGALLDSARRCAEGVVEAVRAGVFWPPAGKVEFDDFKNLGFPNIMDSLDGQAFGEVFAGGR